MINSFLFEINFMFGKNVDNVNIIVLKAMFEAEVFRSLIV